MTKWDALRELIRIRGKEKREAIDNCKENHVITFFALSAEEKTLREISQVMDEVDKKEREIKGE